MDGLFYFWQHFTQIYHIYMRKYSLKFFSYEKYICLGPRRMVSSAQIQPLFSFNIPFIDFHFCESLFLETLLLEDNNCCDMLQVPDRLVSSLVAFSRSSLFLIQSPSVWWAVPHSISPPFPSSPRFLHLGQSSPSSGEAKGPLCAFYECKTLIKENHLQIQIQIVRKIQIQIVRNDAFNKLARLEATLVRNSVELASY